MIRSLGPQHTQHKGNWSPVHLAPNIPTQHRPRKGNWSPVHLAPITGKKKHATLCPSITCTLQYFVLTLVTRAFSRIFSSRVLKNAVGGGERGDGNWTPRKKTKTKPNKERPAPLQLDLSRKRTSTFSSGLARQPLKWNSQDPTTVG